jgi:hypothetical protein
MPDLPRDPVTGRCVCDICAYARRMNQSMPAADAPRLPTDAQGFVVLPDWTVTGEEPPVDRLPPWPLPPLTAHRALLERAADQ